MDLLALLGFPLAIFMLIDDWVRDRFGYKTGHGAWTDGNFLKPYTTLLRKMSRKTKRH